MVKEVELYSTAFDLCPPAASAYMVSDLPVDPAQLSTGSARPAGWEELRLRRVRAKELAAGSEASSVQLMRPQRLAEEEDLMLAEAARYGCVMQLRRPGYFTSDPVTFRAAGVNITGSSLVPENPEARPVGWQELRRRRVHAKERAAGLDSSTEDVLAAREKQVPN